MMKILPLLVLVAVFTSCRTTKLPDSRQFTVVDIRGNKFTAVSGKTKLTFTILPGDSVWIGKKIEVARAKKVK